jgi:hypothetical protein
MYLCRLQIIKGDIIKKIYKKIFSCGSVGALYFSQWNV